MVLNVFCINIFLSLSLLCSAERPPSKISVLSMTSPHVDFSFQSLLGKSAANLSTLGFVPSPAKHHCERLLLPEWGAISVKFAGSLICARFETPGHSVITTVRELQDPPTNFLSREEVYIACSGRCIARFEKSAVIASSFDGRRFSFRRQGLFYEKEVPRHENRLVFTLTAGCVLFLQFLRSRGNRVWLALVMLVCAYYASGNSEYSKFNLSVREVASNRTAEVHGYRLLNFARELRHKGSANCAIFTCNAYESAVNLRFSTNCDVINFRVTQVLHRKQKVVLNWLKVLVALWILENEDYARVVYIDRDLILNKNPLNSFDVETLIFSDLGGGKPDSAMFIADGHANFTGTVTGFFKTWLDQGRGKTRRRDGGEEQEALLNLHKSKGLKTLPRLYSFQCGRNAMNRAQCLLERQVLSWNRPLFFSKVAIECCRIVFNLSFPSRLWMPVVFLYHHRSSLLPNAFLTSLVSIAEVVLYNVLFFPKNVREMRCSAAAAKSISHGSFDNPYQGTFTGVFTDGIARKGPFGWNCYKMSEHEERWHIYQFRELITFSVAQLTIVLFSTILRIKHMLDPMRNMQLFTQKRD